MDAEVSTHTFLTMIIEESVCFMSCEPIFLLQLFLCGTHGIYIYIFSSTEHCAWAIISPKEFKSCVTRISFALLYWKTELSAFEWIFNVMQLILVKGILSTKIVIFSYPKLLSFSVLTFIKWILTPSYAAKDTIFWQKRPKTIVIRIIVLDDNIQIYSYGLLCEPVLSIRTV